MKHVTCHTCGVAAPAQWEVSFIEGRRVAECGGCGAHYLWRIRARTRLPWRHEAMADDA